MSNFWQKPKSLKRRFLAKYSFLNWVIGNLLVPLGICLATKAGFGLSMIGAGPYILHVFLRDSLPWFTQGTAEYFYEFFVMILVCLIVRQCKLKYLMVFIEALIVGFIIDGWFFLLGGNAVYAGLGARIGCFALSLVITGLGVAFYFRTELPRQAYDFAVVKITNTYHWDQKKVKLATDWTLFAIALALSLICTKKLTGIGVGTVITTVLNAYVIDFWGKRIDRFEKPGVKPEGSAE